ncbi:DUF1702 family protein [Prauserella muralis]|uniref:DUF1702 family protein n=1 Tax=Prauserella muralis TaxID=588067 RepID=UPI000DD4EBB4|nr:DUF1702 family protein [Prauserella muralis]TWE13610.1 uncharacterized protein DUF1702 [Prauserella muralis]
MVLSNERTAGSRPATPQRRRAANLLRQDLALADFGARRFRLRSGAAREQLETSARSFLAGFNAAAEWRSEDRLASDIAAIDAPMRGFAFEGAGMACALLDILTCARGRRTRALLDGPGSDYRHLIHVGTGWAFAKLRLRPGPWARTGTDPLLRWLAWDGFGFHQGFFHSDRVVGGTRVEPGLTGDRRAIRDQGLGRALWFHECADPDGVALRIAEFPAGRRGDLWSGIGLAATYAGGVSADELALLAGHAGTYRAELAQGCAFASAARRLSGIVPRHTETAAAVLAGAPVAVAAGWTDQAMARLGPHDGTSGQYQRWRAEIRQLWTGHVQGEQ